MNALLWTLQVPLAVVFAASGAAKISQPKDRLVASGQTGVAPFPLPVIRVRASLIFIAAITVAVGTATIR